MEKCGAQRVEIAGVDDKRQITAVFCGTMLDEFLPPQLIYCGKTTRCHPNFTFPSNWDITHAPKHWTSEGTMIQYVTNIIVPFVERVRADIGDNKTALVIIDNFKGQTTKSVQNLLEDNDLLVSILPPNTTADLQSMDLSVNKPAKQYLQKSFEDWYANEIAKQLSEEDFEGEEEETTLKPIDMSFSLMKELGGKCCNNPHIVVNGFVRLSITGAYYDGDIFSIVESEDSCTDDDADDSSIYSTSSDLEY